MKITKALAHYIKLVETRDWIVVIEVFKAFIYNDLIIPLSETKVT